MAQARGAKREERQDSAEGGAASNEVLNKIASTFPRHYEPVTSATLSDTDYCLHLAATHSWHSIAATVSDGTIYIYNRDTLEQVEKFESRQKRITGIQYSPSNNNILWTSGSDGLVKMWDVRNNRCEKEFSSRKKDSSPARPLTCMDLSANERILCGGTELVGEDAFVLFWDVRGVQLLGSYSQSHTDDLTQVRFNPSIPDTLATAAADCLVNIFDISHIREVDAFTYCLNTETVVDKLFWLSSSKNKGKLAGLTDVETLQYWDIKEAAPLHKLTREDIAKTMMPEGADDCGATPEDGATMAVKLGPAHDCYMVSVDRMGDGSLSILAGYRSEDSDNFLRSLKFDPSNGRLTPLGAFISNQKLLTTRTSLYDPTSDTYVTGGECGILRLWRSKTSTAGGRDTSDKAKKKKKKNKSKPY